MDNTIDVFNEPELDGGVDAFGLESTPPPSTLSPEAAEKSAAEMHFATGLDSPGKMELSERLLRQSDQQVREGLALTYRNNEINRQQFKLSQAIQDMRTSGRPMTEMDFNMMLNYKAGTVEKDLSVNPDTFIEKSHAERVGEASDGDLPDWAKRHVAIARSLHTLRDEIAKRAQSESTFSKVANFAETLIPGRTWYLKQDAIEGAPTSSVLTGTNIKDQIQHIFSLPVDEAKAKARAALEEMYQKNPGVALQFAEALTSYGDSEALMDNMFDVAEVASVLPIGTIKNISLAGIRNFNIPSIRGAAGQVSKQAYDRIRDEFINVSDIYGNVGSPTAPRRGRPGEELLWYLPTLQSPTAWINRGGSQFSAGYTARLLDVLHNYNGRLMTQLRDGVVNVSRLEEGSAAQAAALRETEELFRQQYNHVAHAIVDVEPIRSIDNVLTNTDHIRVRIGDTLRKPFESREQAQRWAQMADIKGYDIERVGRDGYHLVLTKAVDETTPTVQRALRIDTQANPTPAGKFRQWLGGTFVKRDNLVNKGINQDLKAATLGAPQYQAMVQNMMEEVLAPLPRARGLTGRKGEDLLSFMEAQRSFVDPITGDIGRFSGSQGAFEADFLAHHGRRATEAESTAYAVLRSVSDFEWAVNNLNATKMKQSKGVENHRLRKGKEVLEEPVEGTFRSEIDWSHDGDLGIAIIEADGHVSYVRKYRGLGNPIQRAEIDNMLISEGRKAIQLSPQGRRQFDDLFGTQAGKVHYVISREVQSQPLSLVNIPYRPGGHHFYQDKFLIAQPRMRRYQHGNGTIQHDFDDDTAIFYTRTNADAMELSDHMEQARRALAAGNTNEAQRLVQQNLPFTFTEFDHWFTSGRLDLNTPITFKNSGGRTIDNIDFRRQFENLLDNRTDPYELFNDDTYFNYSLDRTANMSSINRGGTANNPIWQVNNARMFNPVEALNTASLNVTRAKYFDDVKVKSARQFVQEFGDLLAGRIEDIEQFPIRSLVDGEFRKDITDKERLAAAKNFKRSLLEFLQIKPDDRDVNWYVETAFDYLGPRRGNVAANLIEFAAERRPLEWTRKWLGFQFRLGLFNPVQLFLQASGQINTIAIEGLSRGMRAYGAKDLMHPLLITGRENQIQHMADLSTQLGWDRRHFIESFEAMRRSGWHSVDDTFADLSDYVRTGQSRFGKTLANRGLVFFNHGERSNRITAWNAAYLRWRDANPIAYLDDNGIKEILARADLLTMNMTRASSSAFQHGWAAFPFQFMSYQSRLMELMWGGQIDRAAKLRLLGVNSAMYGVPMGVGGTALGVYPWQSELKQELEEHGYNLDQAGWDLFLNGVPQAMAKMAGYDADIPGRFGPNGWSIVKDLFDDTVPAQKRAIDLLTGPSGKTAMAIAEPLATLLTRPLREDLTPATDDLIKLAENITTYNNFTKAYVAITTGEILSKDGRKLSKGYNDAVWAATMGILGVQPEELSRYYRNLESKDEIRKAQEDMIEYGIKEYRKGLDPSLSHEDRVHHMNQAKAAWAAGKLTLSQRSRAMTQALKGNETKVEKLDEQMRGWDTNQMNKYIKDLMKDQ